VNILRNTRKTNYDSVTVMRVVGLPLNNRFVSSINDRQNQ